jgi:uncharacterized alpha-E superfamily protein
VLLSLDATQSYNSEVQEPITQDSVIQFLLHNERLPRSIAYGLNSIRQSLRGLPRHERSMRHANRLRRKVTDAVLKDSAQARAFLDEVQIDLAQLDKSVYQTYFEAPRHLKAEKKSSRQRQRQKQRPKQKQKPQSKKS